MQTHYYSFLLVLTVLLFNPLRGQQFFKPDLSERIVKEELPFDDALLAYNLYEIDNEQLRTLVEAKAQTLSLDWSFAGEEYVLELKRNDRLFAPGFRVMAGNKNANEEVPYSGGAYYHGKLKGIENSLVAISFFDHQIMGVVSTERLGNVNIGLVETPYNNRKTLAIAYQEAAVVNPPTFSCEMEESPGEPSGTSTLNSLINNTICFSSYLELDHELYLENGETVAGATDFITGAFNVVATLYDNEQITAWISEIFVWTVPDNYPTTSSADALDAFRDEVEGGFNGDLAHLITRATGGLGGRARIDAICSSIPRNRTAYSNINSGYSQLPNYSWTVNVLTHEIGHNLGSRHTHDCVWNGNNTQIDDCGNDWLDDPNSCYDEDNPIFPPSGGTIMSYCHLTNGVGMNFNEGFGPQPGDLIRSITQGCSNCQNNSELLVDPEQVFIAAVGGTEEIDVTANVSWMVSENVTWLSVSPTNGNGNGSFIIDCDQNFGANPRTATITVTGGGITRTITVEQSATIFLCNIPPDIELTSTGVSHFRFDWDNSTIETTNIRYREVGTTDWVELFDYANGVHISSSKLPCTTYEWQIQGVCLNDMTSEWSQSYFAETTGCDEEYCYSYGNTFDYWITGVNIAEINNNSGNGYGYEDFTDEVAELLGGETYSITLNSATDESNQIVFWSVWIDLNRDNDFLDAGEQVLSTTSTSGQSTTPTFVMPNNINEGFTRVRVAMSPDGAPNDPCQTGDNLDVEDYTAYVVGGVVNQLEVNPEQVFIAAVGGTEDISVTANVSWTVSESVSWLSVSPTNGNSNGSFIIDCEQNFGANPRTTTITVTGGGITRTITVEQSATIFLCNIPPDIELTSTGVSHYRFDWDNSTTETTNIRYREVGATEWVELFDYANGIHISSSKLPCSTYEWQIQGVCLNDLTSPWSDSYFAETTGCDETYCYSYGNSFDYWITGVNIAEIDNDSGNGYGYEDFTDEVAELLGGETYSITLNSATDESNQTVFWSVWIDLNRDEDFLDAGEQVLSTTSTSGQTISPSFVMPTNINNGFTRVRVAMSPDGAINDPCQTGGNMDVEDYSAAIESAPELSAFPENVFFDATGGSEEVTVNSNIDWIVSESASWFSVSPMSGSGNGSFVIDCDPNLSTSVRTATITITGGGLTITITVEQAGLIPILIVSPENVFFDAAGGSEEVSVSSNVDWTVSESTSWFSVSPMSGSGNGSFIIDCDSNPGVSTRTATITITGGGLTITITVEQAATGSILIASPEIVFFDAAGGSEEVSVSSNVDWTVSESASWFTVSPMSGSGNGSFIIDCDPNSGTSTRTATITITGGGLTITVTVEQAGVLPFLVVNPDNVFFDAAGGNQNVAISSNVNWSITESAPWFDINPQNGTGDGIFTITCQLNPNIQGRSATITITGGGLTFTVTVEQTGTATILTVDPELVFFDTPGGTAEVDVSSNVSWIASEEATWFTISSDSGNGNGSFVIDCDPNTGEQIRTATITITGGGTTVTISVEQAGIAPILVVTPENVFFDASGGTETAVVNSNVNWMVSESIPWLSLSLQSGSGDGSFIITCQPYTGTQSRTGTIIITGGGITRTIIVEQAGMQPFLSANPESVFFDAPGDVAEITVNSNVGWTVSEGVSWLSLSPQSGSGSGSFVITCDPNPGTQIRNATVTLSGEGLVRIIEVGQAGAVPYLNVNQDFVYFNPPGGSEQLELSSNISWAITSSETWATISPANGNGDVSLFVDCEINNNPETRAAIFTIIGGGLSTSFTIEQFGTNIFCVDSETTIDTTICVGESVIIGNNAYTESGTYENLFQTEDGCDSLIILDLEVFNLSGILPAEFTTCPGVPANLLVPAGYLMSLPGEAPANSLQLLPGTYSITLEEDLFGCQLEQTVTVSSEDELSVTISGDLSLCASNTTTLTASPGTTYSWSTGATTADITATTPGEYCVTVTAEGGCEGSSCVIVNNIANIEVTISGETNVCADETTILTASGGSSYEWSGGATPNNATNELSAGEYSLTVTDAQGCSTVENISISIDQTAPVITNCPAGQTLQLAAGQTSIVVTWPDVVAVDNCEPADVNLMSSHQSGDSFVEGITNVTYTASNAAEQSSSCTFDITVLGAEVNTELTFYLDTLGYTRNGDTLCVPVRVLNFVDVAAFQLSLLADDEMLSSLDTVVAVSPLMGLNGVEGLLFDRLNSQQAQLIWLNASGDGLSLADGSAIFTVKLLVDNPPPGTCIPLAMTDMPLAIEAFVTSEGAIIPNVINGSICLASEYTVSGEIYRIDDEPIHLAEVSLLGNDSTQLDTTDVAGRYGFSLVLGDSEYSLRPARDFGDAEGLSVLDMITILRHIQGLVPIDDPYLLMAADVNQSQSISTADILEIRELLLGNLTAFINHTSWFFVPQVYVFPNPANPWEETVPNEAIISNLDADTVVDFYGLKTGDVNLSNIGQNLTTNSLLLSYADQEYTTGQVLDVAFHASDFANLSGFQLALTSSELEILDLVPGMMTATAGSLTSRSENWLLGELPLVFLRYQEAEGSTDEPLFTLRLRAKVNGRLSDQLHLNHSVLGAEAFTNSLVPLTIELNATALTATHDIPSSRAAELLRIQPNPFRQQFQLEFYLPQATDLHLQLLDVQGRVAYEQSTTKAAGVTHLTITPENVLSSGVYFCRWQTERASGVVRVVKE